MHNGGVLGCGLLETGRYRYAGDVATTPAAAVFTGVSPATGPLAGGTSVRVVGRGLAGSSDWRVGGQSATCTVAGDTAATCVVPLGLAAGPVPVTFTPAGGAPYLTTAKATYTYR
ncbi:MAG: IPT/TIG domain-containing protein [Actinomycetota bacterium]|nr:IPT/TIG domain-containing protein [Actinomycetota bacterium]